MKRRTLELITATALGIAGTLVVLGAPGAPATRVRAPLCEPAASGPLATASVPDAATSPEAVPTVAPGIWRGVAALGYVQVDAVKRVELSPGETAEVELMLTPSPRACSELVEGRCMAGCFEVMAAAAFDGSLHLEVSPPSDPSDVIAGELESGRVVSAGHCRGFALGHAGHARVRARVSAPSGHGSVELAAWRHPESESTPSPRLTLRLPPLGSALKQVLADTPACAEMWDEAKGECRFHGSVGALPLSETCRGGCSRWTYRFEDGRLTEAELRRSVADVDAAFVGSFVDEASWIAAELDRVLGASGLPESLASWNDVESPALEDFEPRVLQRRSWVRPAATTAWELVGIPGHHPVVELNITDSGAQ